MTVKQSGIKNRKGQLYMKTRINQVSEWFNEIQKQCPMHPLFFWLEIGLLPPICTIKELPETISPKTAIGLSVLEFFINNKMFTWDEYFEAKQIYNNENECENFEAGAIPLVINKILIKKNVYSWLALCKWFDPTF